LWWVSNAGRASKGPGQYRKQSERSPRAWSFGYGNHVADSKNTRQVSQATLASSIFASGLPIEGYEIHMGESIFNSKYIPLFENKNGDHPLHLGLSNPKGTLVGTYVHGLLDNEEVRQCVLKHIRSLRNLPETDAIFSYREFREQNLNRLAELIRDSVDMTQVKEIVNGTW